MYFFYFKLITSAVFNAVKKLLLGVSISKCSLNYHVSDAGLKLGFGHCSSKWYS